MPANTSPIFSLTPNVGRVAITATTAQVKSTGTSAGSGVDLVFKTFTAGANGSLVDRVRFFCTAASAAVTATATTLRIYLSTVASPGATVGGTDTFLLGEVSVPAVIASHSTNACNFFDFVFPSPGFLMATGTFLHVSQHVAQANSAIWQTIVLGSDF